jgi:hypothetical protein
MQEKQQQEASTPTKTDYRLRVSRIWNGKVAPQGKQYVIIDFKKNNSKYTNNLLVEGSLTPEEITTIGDLLRDGLRKKFNV